MADSKNNRSISAQLIRLSSGFSLIEILITIAVVVILATIMIAVVGKSGRSAQRAQCASNLRQIHAAIMLYANDNQGYIVLGHSDEPGNAVVWSNGWHKDRWESPLAAYVGGKDAWGKIVVCPANRTDMPVEASPRGWNVKNDYGYPYIVNYNVMSPYGYPRRNYADITSPSRTVMVTDSESADKWMRGFSSAPGSEWNGVAEKHQARVNVLWADGHVSPQRKQDIVNHIKIE